MKKSKDIVKIVSQSQIEKQLKHIGSAPIRPGHKCFKVDNKTGVATPANVQIFYAFNQGIRHKVVVEEGYTYINALNASNAERKFAKLC